MDYEFERYLDAIEGLDPHSFSLDRNSCGEVNESDENKQDVGYDEIINVIAYLNETFSEDIYKFSLVYQSDSDNYGIQVSQKDNQYFHNVKKGRSTQERWILKMSKFLPQPYFVCNCEIFFERHRHMNEKQCFRMIFKICRHKDFPP